MLVCVSMLECVSAGVCVWHKSLTIKFRLFFIFLVSLSYECLCSLTLHVFEVDPLAGICIDAATLHLLTLLQATTIIVAVVGIIIVINRCRHAGLSPPAVVLQMTLS